MSYQITTSIIGILIAVLILYMVRRDHIHGPYAIWWLTVALSAVILGVMPRLLDQTAGLLGISYPPALLFGLAIAAILLKLLKNDIESSKHERRIRRLAQKLAVLTEENHRLRGELDQQTTKQPRKKSA